MATWWIHISAIRLAVLCSVASDLGYSKAPYETVSRNASFWQKVPWQLKIDCNVSIMMLSSTLTYGNNQVNFACRAPHHKWVTVQWITRCQQYEWWARSTNIDTGLAVAITRTDHLAPWSKTTANLFSALNRMNQSTTWHQTFECKIAWEQIGWDSRLLSSAASERWLASRVFTGRQQICCWFLHFRYTHTCIHTLTRE